MTLHHWIISSHHFEVKLFPLKYQELIMQQCSFIFKENRILKLGIHHCKSHKHENSNMQIIISFKMLELTI
jgi:hypothetical protein